MGGGGQTTGEKIGQERRGGQTTGEKIGQERRGGGGVRQLERRVFEN